jgi:solute:Na+ symporter, SSS family
MPPLKINGLPHRLILRDGDEEGPRLSLESIVIAIPKPVPTINLSTTDLAVMAVYLILIVAWGIRHASRGNEEGYFLGGRGMTWPLIGLSMMAMCVSSSSLVGWSGDAYDTGIAVFNYGIAGAILPILFFIVFFLPFYLRNRIFTLPEFLQGRYDSRSRYYLSSITIIGYTFADAAVTLYAGGLMVQLVFPGADLSTVIWGIAILAASYTLIGGLSAVMWVDLIQSVVLFIGSVILTWIAFGRAGGWDAVMNAAPEGHLSLIRPVNDPSVPWPALLISLPLMGFYFWGLSQAMVQRTLSAKNIEHGRWGNLFAAALNFSVFFVMVLPGLAGRVLFPDLDNPNKVYPTMVFNLLPQGIMGVVVIGFIAAMVSTLSSILNSAQTLVTMDIISPLRRGLSGRSLVRAGNIAGIVIIIIAALWAPNIGKFGSVVKYFQQLLAFMAPPVVAVFLAGLFWRRASATGAFSALLSGLTIAVSLLLFIDRTPLATWNFLYVAPLLFVVSLLILVAVSLFTAAPSPDVVRRYVWSPSFFRDETAGLAGTPWYRNYRVLSLILLALTAVFVLVWR